MKPRRGSFVVIGDRPLATTFGCFHPEVYHRLGAIPTNVLAQWAKENAISLHPNEVLEDPNQGEDEPEPEQQGEPEPEQEETKPPKKKK